MGEGSVSIKGAEIMTEDPYWQDWLEVTYRRAVERGDVEPIREIDGER